MRNGCRSTVICDYVNYRSQQQNQVAMLLAKTSSLPQIKVNLGKYDNFFTKKSSQKDLALDQPEEQQPENESEPTYEHRKKAHSKNLEIIDRKSTIRSKVESYLTDSRKMGILDHNVNETTNRRSLTRISLQAMKPIHTSSEQLKRYLTQLKGELNEYFEKNQHMQHQISNTQGRTTQVKERIIFYEQLAQKTWIHRYQLLDQRHNNLEHIRYETERLKFMQQRLKDINIVMRKRVKDAQNALKNAENEAKAANEQEGIRQDDLDNKTYLLKHYQTFQMGKSEGLSYKTEQAIRNMQQNQAAAQLRREHAGITIMEPNDYREQKQRGEHQKLCNEITAQRVYGKMLEAAWTRCSTYYQQYEKAETLMKMHALDRNALVQHSYKKSFEIKQDLEAKILEKEKIMAQLEADNSALKQQYTNCHYGQIEEIEKWISNIKLEFSTGRMLLKEKEEGDQQNWMRQVIGREEEIGRAMATLARLRQWIKSKEKMFHLTISKKQPISEHFHLYIQALLKELQLNEPTFSLKPQQPEKKAVPKTNKYGNLKKRK